MRGKGPCPIVLENGVPVQRMPAPSALLPAINAFPLPSTNGLEDATNGFGQFIGAWSNASSINSTSIRFDHAVIDKLRFFFRFSDTGSSSASSRNLSPRVDSNTKPSFGFYHADLHGWCQQCFREPP